MIKWAGANNPLWYISEQIFKEVKPDKQPIGKHPNSKLFTTHELLLNKGDTLFLFTDGFADQFGGPKGKKFKYKQLAELLLNNTSGSPEQQKILLHNSFESWRGDHEQIDDVCIVGIRL
jgi:serine phosphatase RsbU (regulator of sigma subunit)